MLVYIGVAILLLHIPVLVAARDEVISFRVGAFGGQGLWKSVALHEMVLEALPFKIFQNLALECCQFLPRKQLC